VAKAVHSKYSKLREKLRLKDRVHGSGPQLEPVVHEEPPDGEGGREDKVHVTVPQQEPVEEGGKDTETMDVKQKNQVDFICSSSFCTLSFFPHLISFVFCVYNPS
jgi:hypothetical protein